MSDYFDYPQDARATRQPTSPHLRLFYDCDDCGHGRVEHSSEPGVGCLHDMDGQRSCVREDCGRTCSAQASGLEPCWQPGCPCLRPGTSQADQ